LLGDDVLRPFPIFIGAGAVAYIKSLTGHTSSDTQTFDP
jgi:hypothetical protein